MKQETGRLLKNKIYLYLTEFFSGMAIMAVELGASRLLAPYFSSSQIVWTIIIATIMIAMALGNVYGGKSADKRPDPDILYKRFLIAAVWIAAIPVLGKYVILLISGALILTINSNLLVIAAFIACMVIFVFPCFLLGTVTPSLVKYTVDSLEESGTTVGTLGAFNTVGSIIGTFLPTFVTIPAVGTAATFLIFSGIILVLALVYFIDRKTKRAMCIICSILFVVCIIFGNTSNFAFWEKGLAYEGESIYNYLQVKESEKRVILSTNVLFGVQSVLEKEDSLTGMYYDYAMAAPAMAKANAASGADDVSDNDAPVSDGEHVVRGERIEPGISYGQAEESTADGSASALDGSFPALDILILGMGSGTFYHQCESYYGKEDLNMRGVEIDEKITDLAHEYFRLPEDAEVTTYDGRAFLQADDGKYDVIMVDAYQDITIPFQMSSVEFFASVKEHLKDNGVMVVNMNMRTGTDGGINEYLQDTIASVFDHVYTVDVKGNTNRELFAGAYAFDERSFLKAVGDLAKGTDLAKKIRLESFMSDMAPEIRAYSGGGHIFTDDKAPVELLGMRAIDEIIKDELSYYKELYKEEGIDGLLSSGGF